MEWVLKLHYINPIIGTLITVGNKYFTYDADIQGLHRFKKTFDKYLKWNEIYIMPEPIVCLTYFIGL